MAMASRISSSAAIYGDDVGVDGDAFVLAPDGTRTKLPTTRGLRSLAIAGGDLYVGDGWHQNYAAQARGLVTRIHHDKAGFHAELVEDTRWAVLDRAHPARDGRRQAGARHARQQLRARVPARRRALARSHDRGAARDIAVGDLDGKPGDEVLIVGDKPALVDLRGVRVAVTISAAW